MRLPYDLIGLAGPPYVGLQAVVPARPESRVGAAVLLLTRRGAVPRTVGGVYN